LATNAEAKQLATEVRSKGALAVLSPSQVGDEEKGSWIAVLATDKNGRQQVRQRWLLQLGAVDVEYTPTAPQVEAVQLDTVETVLAFNKEHCEGTSWKAVESAPREAAARWLRVKVGASVLDVRPPTRVAGRPGEIQVVATISTKSEAATLRASGKDGVWVRPFYKAPQDRDRFNVVLMERGKSLDEACRAAERLAGDAWGVVPTRQGYAVRVLADQKERVHPCCAQTISMFRWARCTK
jgi:hypothetical protein